MNSKLHPTPHNRGAASFVRTHIAAATAVIVRNQSQVSARCDAVLSSDVTFVSLWTETMSNVHWYDVADTRYRNRHIPLRIRCLFSFGGRPMGENEQIPAYARRDELGVRENEATLSKVARARMLVSNAEGRCRRLVAAKRNSSSYYERCCCEGATFHEMNLLLQGRGKGPRKSGV